MLRLILVLDLILIAIYSMAARVYVPIFEELLNSFDVDMDMPILSDFVYKGYLYWPLLLSIPVFLYFHHKINSGPEGRTDRVVLNSAAALLFFLAAWLPLSIWGLYWPIFILGSGES